MTVLKNGQATASQGHYNVNICLYDHATPWSIYTYQALTSFKSMVVIISDLSKINFFVDKGGESLSKLNHIIKQSYNENVHYLFLAEH